MAKVITKEIINCISCPHCKFESKIIYLLGVEEYKCGLKNDKLIAQTVGFLPFDIPDWCPLPEK